MILASIRIEPRSDHPSPMQSLIDGYALAFNAATFTASLASPFHLAMMAWRLNRSLARLWA